MCGLQLSGVAYMWLGVKTKANALDGFYCFCKYKCQKVRFKVSKIVIKNIRDKTRQIDFRRNYNQLATGKLQKTLRLLSQASTLLSERNIYASIMDGFHYFV